MKKEEKGTAEGKVKDEGERSKEHKRQALIILEQEREKEKI